MADSLQIRVLVRPKAGILDPQGEAVRSALPALGFEGVRTVHVGRLIEMEVESSDEVDAMCQRLLSNPTIEEYEWEVVGCSPTNRVEHEDRRNDLPWLQLRS